MKTAAAEVSPRRLLFVHLRKPSFLACSMYLGRSLIETATSCFLQKRVNSRKETLPSARMSLTSR